MSLIKYNNSRWPFSAFDDFFKFDISGNDNRIKTDIMENDNEYKFLIELPGFNKDDIKVTYEEGYLVVSAKNEKVVEDDKEKFVHRERSYQEYSRKFYLGEIDDTKLSAQYVDGILNIIVPKDEIEKAKAKKYITIN